MKELVEVIAKALVDNPEEVVVSESLKGDDTLIELKVAPADMGSGLDYGTDCFCDPALFANDLAHIGRSYRKFDQCVVTFQGFSKKGGTAAE